MGRCLGPGGVARVGGLFQVGSEVVFQVESEVVVEQAAFWLITGGLQQWSVKVWFQQTPVPPSFLKNPREVSKMTMRACLVTEAVALEILAAEIYCPGYFPEDHW